MKPKSLDFWFEFASPYSYLSAMRIDGLAREAGVDVRYRPFLLGPIFRAQGWTTSPFNLYPAKGRYMWRDMERQAATHGLPFRQPEKFPVYSLYATRVALLAENEDWSLPFIRAVYRANFVDDLDIGDPECVEKILLELGIDGATVLRDAGGAAIKDALRERTEQAMDLGIFGAPTIVAGGDLFWGDDRLEEAITAALIAPQIDEEATPEPKESIA
ncbi:MAG: 2-hydroxychromene-2-carboxylate isomerase [Rhodospirillales bacterium]|nr:2-hydroxychromene-2-carboxylate isomerase [Rhodospirillales bacterium]